jgi:membrane protein
MPHLLRKLPASSATSNGAARTGARPRPRAPISPERPPTWRESAIAYVTDLFFKFVNDLTMNLVGMIAYSVLTSFVSLILAVVLILALLPNSANTATGVAAQINRILPASVRKDADVAGLISLIHSASSILTLIIVIGLLWGGMNMFGAVENAFAFIYRVKVRDLIPQKLMSLIMILLFTIFLPLSFISSLLLGAATTTLGTVMPSYLNGSVSAIIGLAAGLFSLFLLFVVIYIVTPNRPVAWRQAWRGAVVAAVAMWLVNTAFPFYAAHFIATREYGAATIGAVIITITWVWFFSLVLLLGAQINALSMGIAPWKYDVTRILMQVDGPVRERRYRHVTRHHVPLPFSGILYDSYKVLRHPTETLKGTTDGRKKKEGSGGDGKPA